MARQVKRDAVIKRSGGSTRANRAELSREHTSREVSDDERVEMLRQSMFQSSLPTLPVKPGFHRCWLTTTNPRDPVIRREQLGYRLIQASELPGWEFHAHKGGQFDGCLMINEMIASEIPTRLFEKYMANNHHVEPLFMEEQLVYEQKQQIEEAKQYGARVIEAPGNAVLGEDPGVKPFSPAYGED